MIAEACVPIRLDAAVIGVVNVESPVPLPAAALDELEWCARALADRIRELGGRPAESRPQRLAHHATRLAGLTDRSEIERLAVDAARDIVGWTRR